MTVLASLAFLASAAVASAAIWGTVLRYRDTVLANIAAARDIPTTRSFDFRISDFVSQPMAVSKARRSGQRVATRRPVTYAGLRAAA